MNKHGASIEEKRNKMFMRISQHSTNLPIVHQQALISFYLRMSKMKKKKILLTHHFI